MNKRTLKFLIGTILVPVIMSCNACNKITPIPQEGSADKAAQAALQSTGKLLGIELSFTGERKKGIGVVGEIRITAQAVNNTSYSFKKPIHVFCALKGRNGPMTDSLGAPVGFTLVSRIGDTATWKPGETITLSAHEKLVGSTGGMAQLLIERFGPTAGKPVDITASIDGKYTF